MAARSRAALWANAIAHLEEFIAERGHARVPSGYVCSDGMRLGGWVMERRADRRRGTPALTADRIQQLDALGFEWASSRRRPTGGDPQRWADGIAHLEEFIAEHGHTRVPDGWVCEDGFSLGGWAHTRRSERRRNAPTLTAERVAQLDALGFDWSPRQPAAWAAGVDHLTDYVAEHGHARVPAGWTSPDGFNLGKWVENRRTDRRIGRASMTVERVTELDALGFYWGIAEQQEIGPRTEPRRPALHRSRWDNAIAHLEEYIAEHGHARVPQKWVSPDGFKLGIWVNGRRTNRRAGTPTLTPERIAQLDALGFEWEAPLGPRIVR
ncbi:helicase associated domain-containing protein [Rhodococcus spongiicola]|uniref:helicase associated domain-containing protein n=1 Tax=Rhodococcus spongiicola TaxID=2487352 RepID=UPI0013E29B73|nr:helicase associated domain-containing protein [Rhodococcus spongiicola]